MADDRSDQSSAWLHVIGIGEDGWDGLSEEARQVLRSAEVTIGGTRHLKYLPDFGRKRIVWPSPFSTKLDALREYRGRQVAVVVTGDPLWYSAGALIAREWGSGTTRFYPQISAFQLAASRMGWSLADVECLTVHGRPVEQILPAFAPGARLMILTAGASSPSEVAGLLTSGGYGASRMIVLGAMGGADESRFSGTAADWYRASGAPDFPDFHTLCVECIPSGDHALLPQSPGLPDHCFVSDGNFTKSEIRCLTVCALNPGRGKLLWDIGSGHGTVAIEWIRSAPSAEAIGIEMSERRLEMAMKNARILGAPRLKMILGDAREQLDGLPAPDAIFIGGGLSDSLVERAINHLKPFGRLVANAVTLESESLLASLHERFGGDLTRISVARAGPMGGFRGWDNLMPVTQWRYVKWLAD